MLIESSFRNNPNPPAPVPVAPPEPPPPPPTLPPAGLLETFEDGSAFGVRCGTNKAAFPSSARKAFELVKLMLPSLPDGKEDVKDVKEQLGSGAQGKRWAANLCSTANKHMLGLCHTHRLAASTERVEWVAQVK